MQNFVVAIINNSEIILGFVAFFIIAYLTMAVWIRNPKSWTNRWFLLLGIILAVYVPANYFSLHYIDSAIIDQLFWIRFVMALASIKAFSLLMLAHTFPNDKFVMSRAGVIVSVILTIAAVAASLSNLVFSELQYINSQPLPVVDWGMAIFLLNFGGSVILSFVILGFKYIRANGVERLKIGVFLAGIVATFVSIIAATLVSILIFKTSYAIFSGPIFSVILMIAIGRAITKHNFLDIKPIIARSVSYIFFIFIIVLGYSALLFVITNFIFDEEINGRNLIIGIILSTTIALTFQSLKIKISRLTSKLFFKGVYNSDELLAELTQAMIQKIDLNDLTKAILEILVKEMSITKAAFLMIDNHNISAIKGVGFGEGDLRGNALESLLHNDNLKNKKSIIFEELNNDDATKDLFRKNDIIVAIPIRSGDKEVALLILGPKSAGDLYSAKDLLLLEIFASESGIVIENSQLYDNLKNALETKSQFISVVSHQMRTPLSAIRWSLELLQQEKISLTKRSEFIANAFNNSVFLIQQLDDVLTVLAIQDQKISLNEESCDMASVAEKLLENFTAEIKKKHLSIDFNIAKIDAHVQCDISKISKVLNVLFKNAIAYTPAGGNIVISSEQKMVDGRQFMVFSVKDSGMGLTELEKSKIFEKFYRSDRARLVLPDGMGLGMFIAKAFINAHSGSLWVDSQGIGQGSTFSFSLPTNHPEQEISNNQSSFYQSDVLHIKPVVFDYSARYGNHGNVFINLASVVTQLPATNISSDKSDEKTQFFANLSHELKSPLTTIKFITEAMLYHNKLNDQDRSRIQSIHDAAERALNLSTDMINVSKLVGGEVEPKFEMCDLRGIINAIINELKPIAEAKRQKVTFKVTPDLHMVKICNEYLSRAFQNIFDNAISYGSENSEIKVDLSENESHDSYLVCVKNIGPIIPSEELPKMFERFHRVPGLEKIKPSGTGLGLFIAKSAIELNGGKIWIESSAKDGTSVYFTVPFRAPRAK